MTGALMCACCDAPAQEIRLLPYIDLTRAPERAVLTCEDCDPGGVCVELDDWLYGDADSGDVDTRPTLRDEFLERGGAIVELVDAVLEHPEHDTRPVEIPERTAHDVLLDAVLDDDGSYANALADLVLAESEGDVAAANDVLADFELELVAGSETTSPSDGPVARKLLEVLEGEGVAPKAQRVIVDGLYERAGKRLVDMGEAMRLASEPIDYLCAPIAARGFLTMLVGRPGEGKSWLMLALADAVVSGREWVAGMTGFRCKRGAALIVDAENGPVLTARRFTAMGLDDDGVKIADATGLKLPGDVLELEALIELAKPDLVVLDSLRRLAPGMREDKSDDVAPIVAELARIARQYDVALVVIHHRSTKQHAADVRGSSALEDQVDLCFVLERVRGDLDKGRRQLRQIKYRIAPEPKPIWLRLAKTAGFVVVEGAEPWERKSEQGDDARVKEPSAHETLADRIRALAEQVVADDGWPPLRLAAATGSRQDSGTFKKAIKLLVDSDEWDTVGSTRNRRYRPNDSGQRFGPPIGGEPESPNGPNQREQLFDAPSDPVEGE
jgi:hypothetical protein